ncbi:hypothetical protein J7E50_18725 [Pedobacter sp. ISL-68]|uniref:hypothetical protein n=1 Tax=unclassified Pedobacter TaxID=2628915 RepID=UPI001BE8D385|nr:MULTISPECIES: hypothetical protein [unclassified Pedobacter]MBT2559957.1 hypothetical protein [Pedobacter sp. ISL-64]MBT2592262.1 hypothetical protein [Pedobacter sp. ISL-68]
MKKILILSALILSLNFASHSQSLLKIKLDPLLQQVRGFDAASLTSGIIGKLTPALSLTPVQKPTVTTIVKDFLVQKATIMATQKTDPAAYQNKFGKLFSGLKSKLGTALTVAQLAKFTALKPAAPSASNVLSQLFY